MKKINALNGQGFAHPEASQKEILVNGLPFEFVGQWQEYPTKRSFAVSVSTELRRQYYPDDATFGKAMREAGYIPVRTRKLTGKLASYWLYRVTGDDKGYAQQNPRPARLPRQLSRPYLSLTRGLNVWPSMVNGSTSTQITSAF